MLLYVLFVGIWLGAGHFCIGVFWRVFAGWVFGGVVLFRCCYCGRVEVRVFSSLGCIRGLDVREVVCVR